MTVCHAAREFFQAFKADHQSAHGRDLQKLEGVSNPQHLLVGAHADSWRQGDCVASCAAFSKGSSMLPLHMLSLLI